MTVGALKIGKKINTLDILLVQVGIYIAHIYTSSSCTLKATSSHQRELFCFIITGVLFSIYGLYVYDCYTLTHSQIKSGVFNLHERIWLAGLNVCRCNHPSPLRSETFTARANLARFNDTSRTPVLEAVLNLFVGLQS
ncbi:hypothetical protein ABID22_004073 [Pontibacter aydingkolensis]